MDVSFLLSQDILSQSNLMRQEQKKMSLKKKILISISIALITSGTIAGAVMNHANTVVQPPALPETLSLARQNLQNTISITGNLESAGKRVITSEQTDQKVVKLYVKAGSGVDSGVLADEISGFMNETFYKDNQNFTVSAYSMEAMMAETKNMLSMIQKAIAGAAAISLLVGGIGVMNIMIVSITERTKEIGTRKALGATNGFIRLQFITEAIVICLAGGLLGIGLGLGAGLAGAKIMGYHGSVSIKVILGCLLFSFVFGIFFGFYPADHAAKMDPIEALRYE